MVIPRIEVVKTVAPENQRIDQRFQVKGIGEKIVKISQGEDPSVVVKAS